MRRGVIFDFDDTLVDTTGALEKTRLALVHEVYGAGTIDNESALRCWRSAAEWFGALDIHNALQCVGAWHKVRPLMDLKSHDWRVRYEQLEASLLKLVPTVPTLLDHLASEGYALAVVTNGNPDQQRRKFQAMKLDKWFSEESFVICDGAKLRPKPAPDGVLEALKRLDVNQAVLIGDRRSDMIAGFLAGCMTVRNLHKSRIARQGRVWLGTLGDPDLAANIAECEQTLKQLFENREDG